MSHLLKRPYRMRTVLIVCSLVLIVLVSAGLLRTNRPVPILPPLASEAFAVGAGNQANGVYTVQVLSGGTWKTVGTASFGLAYTTRAVSLPGDYDQLRLVQSGGTAAQIDSVLLDGEAPTAISGSSDALALKKMLATDNDVTNAYDDALVLTFPASGSRLEINARIQGDISGMFPFEYPAANTYKPVDVASSFYSYGISNVPTAIDTRAKPFIQVFSRPGTGHPNGYTYAWVANDDEYLYTTVDFTSDNTMDGNEDYAKVHVKTPTGVKDFKVSVAQRTWGDAAFTYTDKVSYQHKLYSFRIPWSEIGAPSGTVELAFAAYGTASAPMPVYRFYNRKNYSHFYTISEAEKANVIATLGSTYTFEGIAYTVDEASPFNNAPLYRFYNKKIGSHFYTASVTEKNNIMATMLSTYVFEGTAYYVCLTNVPNLIPVCRPMYRFYDGPAGHFYTASEAEKANVIANLGSVYHFEGVAFYLAP